MVSFTHNEQISNTRRFAGRHQFAHLHRSGFSLIELVVVIAMIGVLTILVVASVQRARRGADNVMCTSHLRALYRTTQDYALMHKGAIPPLVYNWIPGKNQGGVIIIQTQPKKAVATGLNEYDEDGLICPHDQDMELVAVKQNDGTVVNKQMSYGYNIDFLIRNKALNSIRNPNNLALFFDGSPSVQGAVKNKQGPYQGTAAFIANALRPRHNGKANIVFGDGHVESRKQLTTEMVVASGCPPLTAPGGGGGAGIGKP